MSSVRFKGRRDKPLRGYTRQGRVREYSKILAKCVGMIMIQGGGSLVASDVVEPAILAVSSGDPPPEMPGGPTEILRVWLRFN